MRYIYKNVAGYWIITEASDSVVAVDRSAEGKFRGRALMIELPKEKQYRGSLSPTTVHERTALLETRKATAAHAKRRHPARNPTGLNASWQP